MVLLQISDYSTKKIIHHRIFVAGIDLGTTNSLIATMQYGKVKILVDEKGRHLLPSVVYYHSHKKKVGWSACAQSILDRSNTITSVKRLIGRSITEIKERYPNIPYKFQVSSEKSLLMIITATGLVTPVIVSADILKNLSSIAKKELKGDLNGVVITVPAYFDESQRQCIKDAANIAGIIVLRLLNEPTAAAIAYGLEYGDQEGVIAVYDFGGGTFDISILRLSNGVFEVLATGGDSALGGDDCDYLLANWMQEKLSIKNYTKKIVQYQELLEVAIDTKIALSDKERTIVNIDGWESEVTRVQFEKIIKDIVNSTLIVCRRTLQDASVRTEEIMEVVMVGGSTRIPFVYNKIWELFCIIPRNSIDPDKVVAIGAAIQADILVGNQPDSDILLLDVIPISIGLETIGGLVEKIIPRNTTIPVMRKQEFTTIQDQQSSIMIHILQGERDIVSECRSIARFTLRNLPPFPAGKVKIILTFQIDADGLLMVTAIEKSTLVNASIQVKPYYTFSDTDLTKIRKYSMVHEKNDVFIRNFLEKRVESISILKNLRVTLAMDDTSKKMMNSSMAFLENIIQSVELEKIEDSIKIIYEKEKYCFYR